MPLLDRVPPQLRVDLDLFVQGGLAILRKIERLDYNVWHQRPVLARWEKASLFAGAIWQRLVNSSLVSGEW